MFMKPFLVAITIGSAHLLAGCEQAGMGNMKQEACLKAAHSACQESTAKACEGKTGAEKAACETAAMESCKAAAAKSCS